MAQGFEDLAGVNLGCSKRLSNKAAADENTGGVPSGVR